MAKKHGNIFGVPINTISFIALRFPLSSMWGATQTLDLVWNLSDIANALMAVPNLVSMLVLAPVIKEEVLRFEAVIAKEKAGKKADLIEKNEETLHI